MEDFINGDIQVRVCPYLNKNETLSLKFRKIYMFQHLLELEAKLKGWGQNWLGNLTEFLCYDFPPLNSTPTPPFIG
jgi:hypothetical protein